jgi:hypothetical protein
MDLETHNRIFYLTMVAILVPIFLLLPKLNRRPVQYKWLTILLVFSFLCDFINEIQYLLFRFPVNIILNTYGVINPILLSCFFYSCLQWKKLKLPLIVFNVFYLLFSIANFAFIQKAGINTYSGIVEKLQVMILCLLFFHKVLKELPTRKIYNAGVFWIISSMFVVYSAKLVVFSFAHYLVLSNDNLILLWNTHNVMSIIFSLSVAVGVWMHQRNSSLSESPATGL